MTDIIMPALGMSQDTGRLVSWLKQVGDWVEKGEPLMEIETDKAAVEVESPASGYLRQLLVEAGEEAPVGQVIALLEEKAERSPAPAAAILASPKARALAAQRGLSLAQMHGSGPHGAVLVADVLAANAPPAAEPPPTPSHEAAKEAGPQTVEPPETEAPLHEAPLSAAWRQMIERLSASWPATPQFNLLREVEATQLIAWRKRLNEQTQPPAPKITFTDLLIRLTALALRQHPQVNAIFQHGKVWRCQEIAIGLAIALEDGLVAPVIHHADRLSIAQIAQARLDRIARAETGRLRLEDVQGGALTISNLGMYKVDGFAAIVNPPQAAILAVGRIAERVVALNGLPVVRSTLLLSVSFDHRVVDGARGARFLDTLGDLLEQPPG